MSNFYTEFSCQLDLGTPQKAHAALAFFDHLRAHDSITTPIVYGFEMSLLEDKGTSTLWIRDVGGYGDAEEVVDFVLRLASETALAGLWGFEYPRSGANPPTSSRTRFSVKESCYDRTLRKMSRSGIEGSFF